MASGALQQGKFLQIDLQELYLKTKTKINVNPESTVREVVLAIQSSFPLYKGRDDFGLVLTADPSRLLSPSERPLDLPSSEFLYRRVIVRVQVRQQGQEEGVFFGFDPLMTVMEAASFVEYRSFSACNYDLETKPRQFLTPSYDVFLITSEGGRGNSARLSANDGIRMIHDRTLTSYRIKEGDIFLMCPGRATNAIWKDLTADAQFPIVITSEVHQLTKTLRVSVDMTFVDVLQTFLEKSNLKISKWTYGLFTTTNPAAPQMLDPLSRVGDANLPTPAKLLAKPYNRVPVHWFGTDPAQLPTLHDLGLEVPEVLVVLRDMLTVVDALNTEGIYRKSGSEAGMIVLKDAFVNGGVPDCQDAHTIATVIKRWFKELPRRVCSTLDNSVISSPNVIRLYDFLDLQELILVTWLFEMLAEVVLFVDNNKMDAKNLAIVWGPGVVGSRDAGNEQDPMAGFEETRLGIMIVEKNLTAWSQVKHHYFASVQQKSQLAGRKFRTPISYQSTSCLPSLSSSSSLPPLSSSSSSSSVLSSSSSSASPSSSAPSPASKASPASSGSTTPSSSSSSGQAKTAPVPPGRVAPKAVTQKVPKKPSPAGKFAVGLFDYDPVAEGHIPIKIGERVEVLDSSNPDWTFVKKGGASGYVAANYIRLLAPEEKPALPPRQDPSSSSTSSLPSVPSRGEPPRVMPRSAASSAQITSTNINPDPPAPASFNLMKTLAANAAVIATLNSKGATAEDFGVPPPSTVAPPPPVVATRTTTPPRVPARSVSPPSSSTLEPAVSENGSVSPGRARPTPPVRARPPT